MQAKFRSQGQLVGPSVIDEVTTAVDRYRADVAVVAVTTGFTSEVPIHATKRKADMGIPIYLWDANNLLARARNLPVYAEDRHDPRPYQEAAIAAVNDRIMQGASGGLVLMATGLGKTRVAAGCRREMALGSARLRSTRSSSHPRTSPPVRGFTLAVPPEVRPNSRPDRIREAIVRRWRHSRHVPVCGSAHGLSQQIRTRHRRRGAPCSCGWIRPAACRVAAAIPPWAHRHAVARRRTTAGGHLWRHHVLSQYRRGAATRISSTG